MKSNVNRGSNLLVSVSLTDITFLVVRFGLHATRSPASSNIKFNWPFFLVSVKSSSSDCLTCTTVLLPLCLAMYLAQWGGRHSSGGRKNIHVFYCTSVINPQETGPGGINRSNTHRVIIIFAHKECTLKWNCAVKPNERLCVHEQWLNELFRDTKTPGVVDSSFYFFIDLKIACWDCT